MTLNCAIQRAFDRLSDRAEWALTQWWGLAAYQLGCIACWRLLGEPASNNYATYVTFAVLPLLANTTRRGSLAMQVKIDAATDGDALNRIEERSEAEIEAQRAGQAPPYQQ